MSSISSVDKYGRDSLESVFYLIDGYPKESSGSPCLTSFHDSGLCCHPFRIDLQELADNKAGNIVNLTGALALAAIRSLNKLLDQSLTDWEQSSPRNEILKKISLGPLASDAEINYTILQLRECLNYSEYKDDVSPKFYHLISINTLSRLARLLDAGGFVGFVNSSGRMGLDHEVVIKHLIDDRQFMYLFWNDDFSMASKKDPVARSIESLQKEVIEDLIKAKKRCLDETDKGKIDAYIESVTHLPVDSSCAIM